MTNQKQYQYDHEVEMMLEFFVPLIRKSKTREQAEKNIFWMQYMLRYVVEKYYEPKP